MGQPRCSIIQKSKIIGYWKLDQNSKNTSFGKARTEKSERIVGGSMYLALLTTTKSAWKARVQK